MAKVRRYAAMPLPVLLSTTFACVITSPAGGATVTQGTPVTITGTLSGSAVTVQVKLGSTVLGSASIVGLDWSYSWTPQVGDVGAGVLSAVATAPSGSQATAAGVAVTVAASGFGGDYGALFNSYSGLSTRIYRRGDLGRTGSTGTGYASWANLLGDGSAMTAGAAGSSNGIGSGGTLNGKGTVATNGVSQNGQYTLPSAVAPATTNHHIYSVKRILITPTSVGYMHSANSSPLIHVPAAQTSPAAEMQFGNGIPAGPTTGVVINQWYRMSASFTGSASDVLRVGSKTVTGVSTGNGVLGTQWGWGAAYNGTVLISIESALEIHVEGPLATYLTARAAADATLSSYWAGATSIEI